MEKFDRLVQAADHAVAVWEGGPSQYEPEDWDDAMGALKRALQDLDHPSRKDRLTHRP